MSWVIQRMMVQPFIERLSRREPFPDIKVTPLPQAEAEPPPTREEREVQLFSRARNWAGIALTDPAPGQFESIDKMLNEPENADLADIHLQSPSRRMIPGNLDYKTDLSEREQQILGITEEQYRTAVRGEYKLAATQAIDALKEKPDYWTSENLGHFVSEMERFDGKIQPGQESRAKVFEELGISEEHLQSWNKTGFVNSFNDLIGKWNTDNEENSCRLAGDFTRKAEDNKGIYSHLSVLSTTYGVDIKNKDALKQTGVDMEAFSEFNKDFETLKESAANPGIAYAKSLVGMKNGCN